MSGAGNGQHTNSMQVGVSSAPHTAAHRLGGQYNSFSTTGCMRMWQACGMQARCSARTHPRMDAC